MSEYEKTIQEECYGICWGAQQRIDELNQQLTAANERIKRLEEAGDALANNHNPFTFIDWNKAKEAKP